MKQRAKKKKQTDDFVQTGNFKFTQQFWTAHVFNGDQRIEIGTIIQPFQKIFNLTIE